jgi:hypothetical protein
MRLRRGTSERVRHGLRRGRSKEIRKGAGSCTAGCYWFTRRSKWIGLRWLCRLVERVGRSGGRGGAGLRKTGSVVIIIVAKI